MNLVISSQWGKYFNNEESRIYLNDFIDWLKETEKQKTIIGKCNVCETEFEFPSEEAWESDSKKCECGGTIVRVQIQ
jgi:hypothetical protein